MPRLWTAFVFVLLASTVVRAADPQPVASAKKAGKLEKMDARAGLEFFEARIRPVLVNHCYECHSTESKEAKGGLLLDTREAIRRGGDSGHAVVPGSVADSLIINALNYDDFEMPPAGPLSAEVVADFKRWIISGAPDPREGATAPSGPIIQVTRDLWSLKPIQRAASPQVKDAAWPADDLDRFVLAKLEEKNLQPAADADPLTLVRRVYFDLVGLPPPAETVAQFEKTDNDFSVAYAALVDKLLASPQFGERWGRHWLDVARFAESNGRDRDVIYHEAWRYRQYVIDAVNADMPYDRFVTEQVAGDLLPSDSPAEHDRLTIATGFLAVGTKALSGAQDERRMDLVDEQIDVTTRAVLGLTVACARCHDHKFDPIPTKNYYALAGIFRSTETLYGPGIINGTGKNGPKPFNQNLQELSTIAPVDEREVERQIGKLTEARDAAFQEQRKWLALIKEADAKGNKPDAEVSANRKKYLTEQQRLEAQIETLKKMEPERDYAMAVRDGKKPNDCPVHVRGDVKTLGEVVPRGFVDVVPASMKHKVGREQSGRRELAAWLVDPANPLTPRVAANRIWMHLMGDGIVGTPDNFGSMGEKPTHPELLDYLAAEFRDGGWSTKQLVRKIVLSRTYRLSSTADEALLAADESNELLGRHNVRRVDAESLRDALLAVSGKLDLTPPAKSLVAELAGTEVGRNVDENVLRREFNHRSVYLPILRSLVPEVLKVFDFAEPSIVVGKRSVTTVPTQALFFLNSPYVILQADLTAERLLNDVKSDDAARVEAAYLSAVARRPTPEERKQAVEFVSAFGYGLKSQFADDAARSRKAWSAFCQALFASAEFRYVQ